MPNPNNGIALGGADSVEGKTIKPDKVETSETVTEQADVSELDVTADGDHDIRLEGGGVIDSSDGKAPRFTFDSSNSPIAGTVRWGDGSGWALRFRGGGGSDLDIRMRERGGLEFPGGYGMDLMGNLLKGLPVVSSAPSAGALSQGEVKLGDGTGPNSRDEIFWSVDGTTVARIEADSIIS